MSDTAVVEERALAVPDQAEALVISNRDELEAAGAMLTTIKGLQKEINQVFDPIIKKAHQSHKEAVAQKKKAGAPLVRAEGIIKPKIAIYTAEQERIRLEEETRLRKEAEAKQKAEEEKRIKEAEALEAEGKKEEAEKVISEPIPEPAPIAAPSPAAKVEGVSIKKIWKFRIVDPSKLPREYLMADSTAIGKAVRTQKEKCEIPGVEIYAEDSVAARSG